jgi:hypothetical protein
MPEGRRLNGRACVLSVKLDAYACVFVCVDALVVPHACCAVFSVADAFVQMYARASVCLYRSVCLPVSVCVASLCARVCVQCECTCISGWGLAGLAVVAMGCVVMMPPFSAFPNAHSLNGTHTHTHAHPLRASTDPAADKPSAIRPQRSGGAIAAAIPVVPRVLLLLFFFFFVLLLRRRLRLGVRPATAPAPAAAAANGTAARAGVEGSTGDGPSLVRRLPAARGSGVPGARPRDRGC